MLKKIVVGLFIALMVGAIVVGAIELSNPSSHVLAREGRAGVEQRTALSENGLGGGGGQGRGVQGGQGNGSNGAERGTQPGSERAIGPAGWETIAGTVVETVELVVETSDGQTVQIGLGPSHYRDSQGFAIQVGDQVQVSGYWEDGEFKATQVDNLTAGTQITLRDASGRPMWSGRGRSG